MKRFQEVFKSNSGYRALFVSMATFALAYGLYKGVIDNYLAEIVSMSAFDKGVSEFFRELPGLALVFILAVLYTFSAEKLYRIGAVVMLAGMAAQAVVPPARVLVILCIFVYSLGDHIQLGMRNTLSLEYSKDGRGGEALGLQNAVHQIGMLAGYIVIIIVFSLMDSKTALYRGVFAVKTDYTFADGAESYSGIFDAGQQPDRRHEAAVLFPQEVFEVLYAGSVLRRQEAGLLYLWPLCARSFLRRERQGDQPPVCHFVSVLLLCLARCGKDHRPARL